VVAGPVGVPVEPGGHVGGVSHVDGAVVVVGAVSSSAQGPSGETRSWVSVDGAVLVDGVSEDGGVELVSVLGGVVDGVWVSVWVVVLGAGVVGAGGVLVCVSGVGAGVGGVAGAGGAVCSGGAGGVVLVAGGCSLEPGGVDCWGVDGVVVDGLGCQVCCVSLLPEFSSWASELAAPAVRSQTNVNAIAMPSRSNSLLTGAGLTWDRNRVLLPSIVGILPRLRFQTKPLGKGRAPREVHASRV
jgi:hypothetical protein